MKKVFALGVLTVFLAACNPPFSSNPLADQTIMLGTQRSQAVTQAFSGSWRITHLPAWLKVSRYSGTGAVEFNLTANRRAATPLLADQPQLSDTLNLLWTSADGQNTGTATWTVTADQFQQEFPERSESVM